MSDPLEILIGLSFIVGVFVVVFFLLNSDKPKKINDGTEQPVPPAPPAPQISAADDNPLCIGGLSQLGYAGDGGDGGEGTPANDAQWALRRHGWGCVENPFNTNPEDEARQCILRYTENINSSTGYSQCKWLDARDRAYGNVQCVPDANKDCTPSETCDSKKCCENTGKWQGQSIWRLSDNLVENCNCREGDELEYHSSGAGSPPYVWRCKKP